MVAYEDSFPIYELLSARDLKIMRNNIFRFTRL